MIVEYPRTDTNDIVSAECLVSTNQLQQTLNVSKPLTTRSQWGHGPQPLGVAPPKLAANAQRQHQDRRHSYISCDTLGDWSMMAAPDPTTVYVTSPLSLPMQAIHNSKGSQHQRHRPSRGTRRRYLRKLLRSTEADVTKPVFTPPVDQLTTTQFCCSIAAINRCLPELIAIQCDCIKMDCSCTVPADIFFWLNVFLQIPHRPTNMLSSYNHYITVL
jgi:hypothetical protein